MAIVHNVEWVQKNYADAVGAVVLDVKSGCYAPGAKKERTVVFKCSKCGAVDEMGLNHLIYRHQNEKFHCKNCRVRKSSKVQRKFTYAYIKEFFDSNGVILLMSPDEHINAAQTKIKYCCKKCGKETSASMLNIFYRSAGMEFQFLCDSCKSNSSPTIEYINEKFFKPAGAELLTTKYVNASSPLEFKCTNCGKVWHTNYHRLDYSGSNLQFLCDVCMGKKREKSLDSINASSWEVVKYRRTLYDQVFGRYISFFFNIPDNEKPFYTYHHILPYYGHHDLATSITNIYPLKKEIHSFDRTKDSFYQKLHIPFNKPQLIISDYPDEFKLSFHTKDFKFFDPTKFIVTEIVFPEFVTDKAQCDADFVDRVDATNRNGLLNRKKFFEDKGVLYLPFFYPEFLNKRPIIRSMFLIRGEKLYSGFTDLYGFEVRRIPARKCELRVVDSNEAFLFFEKTHIQGGVKAKYNFGLYFEGCLVGCMSFGLPRVKSGDSYDFELYRLSFELLMVVQGGASRLFKYALQQLSPKSVVSFCDLRFVSGQADGAVYTGLGFEKVDITKPNYHYYDPKTKSFKSRMSYQKHLLKDKLEIFDPDLSEVENCKLNGLVPQYDCGNIKYVWKNPAFVGVKPGQALTMF